MVLQVEACLYQRIRATVGRHLIIIYQGYFPPGFANMSSKIKAIVFDAYGTLLDINSLDRILTDRFGHKSVELSNTWRQKQLEYTWLRTLMQQYQNFSLVTMDALEYSCKIHQVQLNEDIKQQLYKQYLKLKAFPEVPRMVEAISARVPLGILSNADHKMLQGALHGNKISGLFVHVLSAEDVRMFKPRSEIYQMACEKFSLRPDEILFVSSNTWDVAGAKSYGLTVAWLNRSDGVMEELGFEPDIIVEEIEQLLGVINQGF